MSCWDNRIFPGVLFPERWSKGHTLLPGSLWLRCRHSAVLTLSLLARPLILEAAALAHPFAAAFVNLWGICIKFLQRTRRSRVPMHQRTAGCCRGVAQWRANLHNVGMGCWCTLFLLLLSSVSFFFKTRPIYNFFPSRLLARCVLFSPSFIQLVVGKELWRWRSCFQLKKQTGETNWVKVGFCENKASLMEVHRVRWPRVRLNCCSRGCASIHSRLWCRPTQSPSQLPPTPYPVACPPQRSLSCPPRHSSMSLQR